MQRIKPENLIVLMFVAEIGIPLYCHFFYNWSWTDCTIIIWTEIAMTLFTFLFKSGFHAYQNQIVARQLQKTIKALHYAFFFGKSIFFFAISALLLLGAILLSVSELNAFQQPFELVIKIFDALNDDAKTFLWLNYLFSALNRALPLMLYVRKNKLSVSDKGFFPPEYRNSKNLKWSIIGSVLLFILVFLNCILFANAMYAFVLLAVFQGVLVWIKIKMPSEPLTLYS